MLVSGRGVERRAYRRCAELHYDETKYHFLQIILAKSRVMPLDPRERDASRGLTSHHDRIT